LPVRIVVVTLACPRNDDAAQAPYHAKNRWRFSGLEPLSRAWGATFTERILHNLRPMHAGWRWRPDSITLSSERHHARKDFDIMATDPGARTTDTAMDATSLYREDIYTDRKIGTLRVLLPVKSDGSPDTARRTLYQGEAQLMTNMGPLPISFDIEADSLSDAVAKYADATRAGIERAMREIQEMRRQASSSIVLPPAGATLGPGGTLPGGGGKIQLP
jgi:hypothetical protein